MSSSEGARYELVIRPLPFNFSNAALNDLFERFGKITRAEIHRDPHTFAYVQFHDHSAALQAIHEVHGSLDFGKKLAVSWSAASIKSFGTSYDVSVEQHPWKLGKDRIIELFARYGPTVPLMNMGKGFAHVQFAHAEAAQRAIDELDGILLGGGEVSVWWKSAPTQPGNRLFVSFLPFDVSIRTIRNLFGEHGRLTNVHVVRDRKSGEKVGNAFVRFLHEADAERAIDALDGHTMSRGSIRIAWEAASKPAGQLLRIVDLAETDDRKSLKDLFSRYGELRCVEVEYDKETGMSNRKAIAIFAEREEVHAVLSDFGGRFLRNGDGIILMTQGHLLRIGDLAETVDRETLKKVFSRYGELRCVEVEYDKATGRSNRKGFVTFADREEVQAVLNDFGGRFLRNGEGAIMLPMDRLNRELERFAALETGTSSASDSASPRVVITDLLTDSVIRITANGDHVNASVDLIDLSDPSPPPLVSAVDNEPSPPPIPAVFSPVEVGYVYAEKREYEIPVHFYAAPESEKLEMASQILLNGGSAQQDVRKYTKVTLVARSSTELIAAMLRIDADGVDCFSGDDLSIRNGHSSQPSALMSVSVTTASTCSKLKYSQHVLFLSPIAMRAAMDIMMLQRTDVNLVSVLFDDGDDDQRLQVSQLLNVLR